MAPLIADLNTSTSQSTGPSAPSFNFRMPHVFVIPPEEEQQDNPPWCCFDADEHPENSNDLASTPNIHFLDAPYLFQQSENDAPIPLARRTSVRRQRPRLLVSKKLEKKQHPEAIKIIETKSSRIGQRDAREDSDVIEVVKVKRGRETPTDLEENTKAKRSKTLKARATKALQSIKNVGKSSHRTHVKDLWTSAETMPGILKGMDEQIHSQQAMTEDRPPSPPLKKGSLSRGNSLSLSQMFLPMKTSRVESPFTVRGPSSVANAESYRTVPAANPSSLTHLRYNNTNSSLHEVPNTLMNVDTPNRTVSPIPSTKKNVNTKFSVRDLHRLFSFSSSSPDDLSPSPTATVPLPSSARPPTPTLTHGYTDVPMEDDIFVDAHFVNLESPDRRLSSRYHDPSTPRRLSNFSFEMKLDSLHFDALSFDPEDFDVSRAGNVLR